MNKVYVPSFEMFHDAAVHLIEHLQVLSVAKQYVGLSEREGEARGGERRGGRGEEEAG